MKKVLKIVLYILLGLIVLIFLMNILGGWDKPLTKGDLISVFLAIIYGQWLTDKKIAWHSFKGGDQLFEKLKRIEDKIDASRRN